MKGNLWGVVVVALVLAMLPVLNGAFAESASQVRSIENTTVDYSTNYTVNREPVVSYGTVTVTANGSQLVNGTDYQFTPENGTINWQNTATTSDGDAATVNYTAVDHSQTQDDTRGIMATLAPWLGLLLTIVALGTLIRWMPGGGF